MQTYRISDFGILAHDQQVNICMSRDDVLELVSLIITRIRESNSDKVDVCFNAQVLEDS